MGKYDRNYATTKPQPVVRPRNDARPEFTDEEIERAYRRGYLSAARESHEEIRRLLEEGACKTELPGYRGDPSGITAILSGWELEAADECENAKHVDDQSPIEVATLGGKKRCFAALCAHTGQSPTSQLDRLEPAVGAWVTSLEKWAELDASTLEEPPEIGFEGASGGDEYGDAEWPGIVPLMAEDVPDFPADVFPGWLETYLSQLSTFTQTPRDLAGGMALAVLGTIAAKKYEVQVFGGWIEPVNVYVLPLMEPGNRKSAVVSAMVEPIRKFQREEAERLGPEIRASRSRFEILTKQRNEFVSAASKAQLASDRDHATHEVLRIDEEMAANPVRTEPLLLCDDITPETLATRMLANGGRMGILSSEPDAFDVMAGRYAKNGQSNIGIYLKSHAGDDHRVDRGSRPSEQIVKPALSIGCCVQPEIMAGLLSQKSFRGRGLLGRFLYAKPKSLMGSRVIRPPVVDPFAEQSYNAVVGRLLQLPCTTSADGGIMADRLSMSPQAIDAITTYSAEVEPMLDACAEMGTIQDWGGKLVGHVVRIAGLLHIAEHADEFPIPTKIEAETVERAVRLGRYFMDHAQAVFAMMGANQTVEIAEHIVTTVKRHQLKEVSRRDLYSNYLKRRVDGPEDLDAPLRLLVDHGYMRPVVQDRRGSGRKPNGVYAINPSCLAGISLRGF